MTKRVTWGGSAREIEVPKAPKLATHAKIVTDLDEVTGRIGRAETTVKNFGVAFRGVPGLVQWGRYPSRGKKVFEAIGKAFKWDGFKIL